ncbi:Cof-type HAD-IIB family hydrolase [Paenibacillus thermotolerans]|uniref:Cof-type HAD-IIB family hydrolase n=1 Tax=Paenibacillus thermotolerans TaxID=3027807 RepID=UPI0023678E15|nr:MULTISPECIES: Cof-type HAD-IIB family hydrolase [unclassified Paenibacillus]
MSTYKLLALDMDGTLLNEHSEISPQNAEWIRKAIEAGVTVCFSTGRGFPSALPYAEQLGLKTPMVTVNGSEVWKEPHVLYKRTLMESDHIRRLHELAVRYDTWFWAYAVEGLFNKEQWTDRIDGLQWLKFGYYSENDAARAAVLDGIASIGEFEVTNSHPHNIELNPKGISKASGLRNVCGMLGIDMKQVVAVGDSLNDKAMIQAAGLGVAMGNAQDDVKRIADVTVVSNQEHGVAQVIREFVLA